MHGVFHQAHVYKVSREKLSTKMNVMIGMLTTNVMNMKTSIPHLHEAK